MQRPAHADPAERRGLMRFFYRNWRPTLLGRLTTRCYARLAALGLFPQLMICLQTRGAQTGSACDHVLVPIGWQGAQYLVSMLGEGSRWVRNVRAAGGAAAVKMRAGTTPVVLTEVPVAQRAPILKAWT